MAEGGGLLNRYRMSSPIVGSNPIPSAILLHHFIIAPSGLGAAIAARCLCPDLRAPLGIWPVRDFLAIMVRKQSRVIRP